MSKPTFERGIKATTHPIAAFSGDSSNHIVFRLTSPPAKPLAWTHPLQSDPDGDNFNTFRGGSISRGTGTYRGDLTFSKWVTDSTSFTTADDAAGNRDSHRPGSHRIENEIVSLTDYRRFVGLKSPRQHRMT